MKPWASRLCVVCCGLALPALAASLCACAGPSGGSTPRPQTSSTARPAILSLAADNFADTDGNRYRDSTIVVVYIFSEDQSLPMRADGEFTFTLQGRSGRRLAEWRFDRQQTAAAVEQLPPGPGYIFELSMLESGTDRTEEREADLIATFSLAQRDDRRPPVTLRRSVPLAVGPVSRSR